MDSKWQGWSQAGLTQTPALNHLPCLWEDIGYLTSVCGWEMLSLADLNPKIRGLLPSAWSRAYGIKEFTGPSLC